MPTPLRRFQYLQQSKPPPIDTIDVEQLPASFDDEIGRSRSATSGAPPPIFSAAQIDVQIPAFREVSASDMTTFIGRLPDKLSASNPIATNVLENIADLVSPYVEEMFNRSFFDGHYPSDFQHEFVTPIVQPGKDPTEV
jgi:hypothetical protein